MHGWLFLYNKTHWNRTQSGLVIDSAIKKWYNYEPDLLCKEKRGTQNEKNRGLR